MRAQAIEERAFSRESILLFQSSNRAAQKCRGPLLFVELLGIHTVAGTLTCFGLDERGLAQRHTDRIATALLGAIMIARIREEMLESAEQERAEFPFVPVSARKGPALDKVEEKRLSEILRVVLVVASTAQVKIKRLPVGCAELGQSRARSTGFLRFRRFQHHGPAGGGK